MAGVLWPRGIGFAASAGCALSMTVAPAAARTPAVRAAAIIVFCLLGLVCVVIVIVGFLPEWVVSFRLICRWNHQRD
jgi:hypothetical protein